MFHDTDENEFLSRDTAAAIKYYCFENLRVFHSRFTDELRMTKANFYRIINGGKTGPNNIRKIEELSLALGIIRQDGTGASETLVQKKLIRGILELTDTLFQNPGMDNLGKLKAFIDKYREALQS